MNGSTSSLFPSNSIASDLFIANQAGLGATIREIQHAAMAPAFLMPASMRSSLGIIANTNINTANASSLNSATITSSTITLTGGAVTSLAAEGSTNVYLEGASSNNAFVIKAGLFAEKGSTEYSTILGNGGYSIVESGGNASGTDIGSGGAQFVYSGGTATGTVINTSGTQIIESGGTANMIYIDGGGAAEIVQAGGTDSGAIAIFGGTEDVYGLSKNAVIGDHGYAFAQSGGTLTSATVDGLGSTIYSMSGGMVTNSTAQNSGIIAGFGGTIVNSTVNGGFMNAYSGTTLSNDTVANGGFIDVENGAKADNIIINNNGALDIKAGGSASSVNFAQSNGTMFMDLNAKVGTIYGFDTNNETDKIFITGVSYSSSDTVSLGNGNVLNVNFGGGNTLSLQLDPSFNYTGHNFHINNVGGDVVITDPISGLSKAGATPKFLAKSSVSLESASNASGGQASNGKSLTLISGLSPKYFGAIDIFSDTAKTNGSTGAILDNHDNYGATAVIHNSTTQNSFGSIIHALTHTATQILPN